MTENTRAPADSPCDLDDIPACRGCGLSAGCCSEYPNCPGNPDWTPITQSKSQAKRFAAMTDKSPRSILRSIVRHIRAYSGMTAPSSDVYLKWADEIERCIDMPVPPSMKTPEIWDMGLCDYTTHCLHPDVLYRFTVDPECKHCTHCAKQAKAEYCEPDCKWCAEEKNELHRSDPSKDFDFNNDGT